MNKFFDRDEACKSIQPIIDNIFLDNPSAIWIEGILGVGKTRFLEYINEQHPNLNFFTFKADDTIYYKCEKGSELSSFEYIVALIFEMQKEDPRKFEIFIQDYFDSLEHISFFDACCLIMPQIKYLKAVSNLIETKYKNITTVQGKISDRLVTYQLIDLFSDMILMFLQKVYKTQNIIFCIDDAQWLDTSSLKVIECLIKKNSKTKHPITISLFLTINDRASLEIAEEQNYINIYKTISALYKDLEIIYLENFDFDTTSDVIANTSRIFLIEHTSRIYQLTDGNPLELEHTLHFSDNRLRKLLNSKKHKNTDNDGDYFSTEYISEVYFEKTIYSVILNILSILNKKVSESFLFKCVMSVYGHIFNNICSYYEFKNAINHLTSYRYIKEDNENNVYLLHDSIGQLILTLISQNGDYVVYSNIISEFLLGSEKFEYKLNSKDFLALKLLCESNPKQCFLHFKEMFLVKSEQLEIEFAMLGSTAYCSDLCVQTEENTRFMATKIIPLLVSNAKLQSAQRLCHTIYKVFLQHLEELEQIEFLMNYIKVQVDLSNLDVEFESAIQLFEMLKNHYIIGNYTLKLSIYLLGMSVYEHVLLHDKINTLFCCAKALVQEHSDTIDHDILAIYYRNMGLCYPHSELKSEYFKSLLHALRITNKYQRHLIFGTSMNNLGLSYFYNGEIDKAIKAFSFSKKHLNLVGYNTARITNNIAACHFMKKDYKEAYNLFSEALSEQYDGVFMNSCIKTNLALSLYSLGKDGDAIDLLNEFVKEYDTEKQRTKDTLLYSSAMINRAYIHLEKSEYFKGAELYQKSLIHTYRFQNDLQTQKRTTMRNICMNMAISGRENASSTDMDLLNDGFDYYKKPYSLVVFAFYVI